MRTFLRLLLFFTLQHSYLFAGEYNPILSIGDKAPGWTELDGVDGKKHSFEDYKEKEILVLVFTCNSCPYAVEYEDRINALTEKYSGEDSPVAVVALCSNKNAEDRLGKMKDRAEEKKFRFDYLYDADQKVGEAHGAQFTPEFFVLNEKREVVYMGKLDDSTKPEEVKVQYVLEAIEAIRVGKKPETAETLPIGCKIRYQTKRKNK